MSLIFLSHSSQNNFEAIALSNWLMQAGWDDLFLDLDPERGIAAGERWERALHQAANRCDAVLFLVSRHWLASDWCLREFRLAHNTLKKRIFGLLIEDLDVATLPKDIIDSWQMVNLASGPEYEQFRAVHPDTGDERHVHFSCNGLTRLRFGLNKAGLFPRFFEWPPESDLQRAPYRGMRPMDEEDAGIFFGREAPISELLDDLRNLRETPPPRFMVILGASGSGKSSFLRAGILPSLKRDDRHFLPLPVVRPEQAAMWGGNGLLTALDRAFSERQMGITRGALRKALENNTDTLLELLHQLVKNATVPALVGETPAKPPILVLPIDQGEELFQPREGAEESKALLDLLPLLAKHPDLPLMILVTIRSPVAAKRRVSGRHFTADIQSAAHAHGCLQGDH